MICLGTVVKWNHTYFLYTKMPKTEREEEEWKTQLNLWNTKKTKFSERYDLISEPSSDTKLYEPYDHVTYIQEK